MWLAAEGRWLAMCKEQGKTVFTQEGEWMWCEEGIKPAWQKACMSRGTFGVFKEAMSVWRCSQWSVSHRSILGSLIQCPYTGWWIMKQINPLLWGSESPLLLLEGEEGLWLGKLVISNSPFYKPAERIPLLLRNMQMKMELKSTGVH